MKFTKSPIVIVVSLAMVAIFSLSILFFYSRNNCKTAKEEIALNRKIVSVENQNLYLIAESNQAINKDYANAPGGYNYSMCQASASTKLNFYYKANNQTQPIYTSDYVLTKTLNNSSNLNFNLTQVLQKLVDSLVINDFNSNSIVISGFDLVGSYEYGYMNSKPFKLLIGTGEEKRWYKLDINNSKNTTELNKILNINGNNDFIVSIEDKANEVIDAQKLICQNSKCAMTANIKIISGSDRKIVYKKAMIDLNLENNEALVTGGKEIT